MAYDYDLIVIGVGPAGEKGAAQAAYFGKRVLAVERRAQPGGAGTLTGTLPSKTLRETAMYLSGYHSREMYGVAVELEHSAADYERQVSLAVQSDPDVQAFVERLERAAAEEEEELGPQDVPSGDVIAREFQRFLRQRGPGQSE